MQIFSLKIKSTKTFVVISFCNNRAKLIKTAFERLEKRGQEPMAVPPVVSAVYGADITRQTYRFCRTWEWVTLIEVFNPFHYLSDDSREPQPVSQEVVRGLDREI
jgi:hypothetical protein